ncbi:Cell division protein FtsL [subsurface metagenome]
MRIRRVPLLILTLLVILFFFLNAWQGFRYTTLKCQVKRMEGEQKDWLEKNKKLIAGLAIFSSPARIGGIAGEQLGLEHINSSSITRVVLRQQDKNIPREEATLE